MRGVTYMIDQWKSLLTGARSIFAGCAAALFLAVLVLASSLAEARVTRVVVNSREVVAEGMSFGDTGPYEKLRGTVFFEVNPDDPLNAVVFDLDKAPRKDRGLVEFSANMMIIKPVNLDLGSHELFFEVNNRGSALLPIRLNSVMPGTVGEDHCVAGPGCNDPTTVHDFGNGFMQRKGYTLAWVGWEGDVLPGDNRLTVQFPTVVKEGKPITGKILVEFADAKGAEPEVFTLPLSGSSSFRSYEAVSTDPNEGKAELRMRPSDSPRPPAPNIPEGEVVQVLCDLTDCQQRTGLR